MSALKIIGIVLLIAGSLGLVYGGFTYTSDTHMADLGPLQMTMTEKDHVNIPVWAGIGAILLGGVLLVVGKRA